MRRRFLAAAWLVILLLSGCGASRHLSKSDTQTAIETEQTAQTGKEEKNSEAMTAKTDMNRAEEVVTEVTEFDTALPVDPATGTPPVKRKTTQTKRTATQAQRDITADRTTSAATFENRESSEKSNTTTVAEETSKRGLNWLQSALCLAGITALLFLLIWALVKWFKRY